MTNNDIIPFNAAEHALRKQEEADTVADILIEKELGQDSPSEAECISRIFEIANAQRDSFIRTALIKRATQLDSSGKRRAA